MRTRRSQKKAIKTNKTYWITGVTCTILATGVFVATAPLSGDTTHSNQQPNQTQIYQAQKDQRSMVKAKLESINKEYKKKAKTNTETNVDAYDETETEQYNETYTEASTEAETTQEEQPETETETNALKEEIEATGGKAKSWEEMLYDKNVDHNLLLLSAMNYDTELYDLYKSVEYNDPRGYVTAQNNKAAVIWDAGVDNSQYRGTQGNETLQDFYTTVEETGTEQGGTITHQGIKVSYKTIWLNPGIPATGSLYQITSVEKVN